jgi:hypothetical protein
MRKAPSGNIHTSITRKKTATFEMEVTGIHSTAMQRLANEIVRIKSTDSEIVLNSKNDWAQPALVRVIPVTGNLQETQAGDTQMSRQERREANQAAALRGERPTRRRRVRETETANSSTPVRQLPSQGGREERRLRRGQMTGS